MDLENIINEAWANRDLLKNELTVSAIEKVITKLDNGELRVAEKINNKWETHQWIKKAVVLYFPALPPRLGSCLLAGQPSPVLLQLSSSPSLLCCCAA